MQKLRECDERRHEATKRMNGKKDVEGEKEGKDGRNEGRRRGKIEEDHEDGCFSGETRERRGVREELRRGARTVEVKRNVNGRKSGWASMDEEAERH